MAESSSLLNLPVAMKTHFFAEPGPVLGTIGDALCMTEQEGLWFEEIEPNINGFNLWVRPWLAFVDALVATPIDLADEYDNDPLSKYTSIIVSIFKALIYNLPVAIIMMPIALLVSVLMFSFDLLRFGANWHLKSLDRNMADHKIVNQSSILNPIIAAVVFSGMLSLIPHILIKLNVIPAVQMLPSFMPSMNMNAQLGIYTGIAAVLLFTALLVVNRLLVRSIKRSAAGHNSQQRHAHHNYGRSNQYRGYYGAAPTFEPEGLVAQSQELRFTAPEDSDVLKISTPDASNQESFRHRTRL